MHNRAYTNKPDREKKCPNSWWLSVTGSKGSNRPGYYVVARNKTQVNEQNGGQSHVKDKVLIFKKKNYYKASVIVLKLYNMEKGNFLTEKGLFAKINRKFPPLLHFVNVQLHTNATDITKNIVMMNTALF